MNVNVDKLKYLGISAIYINEAFNEEEESKIKDILFSFNEIKQIYFTDKADYKTIEKVKYYLEISSYIEDENIEKIIYAKLGDEDIEKLLNLSLKNPETWTITYDRVKNTIYTAILPRYRGMHSYLKRIFQLLKNLNIKEKIKVLSEELDGFKQVKDNQSIIDNIEKRVLGPNDYIVVLNKLLNSSGVSTYISKTNIGKILLLRIDNKIFVYSERHKDLVEFNLFDEGFLSPLKFLEEKEMLMAIRKYNIYLEAHDDDLEESLKMSFNELYKLINTSQDKSDMI